MTYENVSLEQYDITFSSRHPVVVIAGPCVVESVASACEIAGRAAEAARAVGLPYVFKASYDKANRTRFDSPRGPGLERGLEMLAEIRVACHVPVLTDVHSPEEAKCAGAVVDIVQVPAFLSRQTDLLIAAGGTGKPVLIKKGQFLAAEDMAHSAEKVRRGGGRPLLCERGTTFGTHDLVTDLRSLVVMREFGPVVFDATHGVRRPGTSIGPDKRFEWLAPLARAAVCVGISGLFLEVHADPANALSDGPLALPLSDLATLLREVALVDRTVKAFC